MRNAVSLEFDLGGGKRGERDDHLRALLCELTGAEDATVVNNNAAAVLLVLNTLAKGREAIVSRGELIEIGGAFRMPDIMARAGREAGRGRHHQPHAPEGLCRRDHDRTGLVLKVHTSNYRIEGFTKEVPARELAAIARERNVPLVNDLGSGTLIDLARFGLAHEPTVAEAIAEGADLVTFSGDKLLGGPQAGFIVGRKELIEKINKNPMKRALRIDKMRIAIARSDAEALSRSGSPRRAAADRAAAGAAEEGDRSAGAPLGAAGRGRARRQHSTSRSTACASQIGSGALPVETIASAGLAIRPKAARGAGRALAALAAALRKLPVPVIGRIEEQALVLDLRCLEDEAAFLANLANLDLAGAADALA